jgi:hypothetical protein
MNELLEQIRSLVHEADEALVRQAQSTRTPKQRAEDFDEALRAHRRAVAIFETLQAKSNPTEELVAALAPLHIELADLDILISEIRFDETERTERLPRVRHVSG